MEFDRFSESLGDNNLKYSWKTINEMIDKFGTHKVCMQGTYADLEELKSTIEELYNPRISYLSYWKDECAFHGWDWSKDDGTMRNQANVTDGITDKFIEIYALILSGLGLRFGKDENGEVVMVEVNR